MDKGELHQFIEKQQPNICQIVAIKDNEVVLTEDPNERKQRNKLNSISYNYNYYDNISWNNSVNAK